MSSTVSIITPAYKAERFIGDAIRSVQGQDHGDWEMVVVDDGSPDGTSEVAKEFARRDARIRLIRQENAGPAAARQRGLDEAKGRFVAFLDSDDYWMPGKLSRQLAFMSQREAAISFTQFRRVNLDGSIVGRLIDVPEKMDYVQLLGNTAIATSTVVVDREKTGPIRMTRTYYDDFALWLSILRKGFLAHGMTQDLMRYRVVGNSVSRNKLRSAYWVWRLYRDVEHLDPLRAGWYLAAYATRAWWKYRKF
jgi:teichuronic acid biosynthesis glycosyltransferase TuaG